MPALLRGLIVVFHTGEEAIDEDYYVRSTRCRKGESGKPDFGNV
jgi:hypothetical protein